MIIIIIIIILIKKPTRAPEVPRVDVWWGLANRLMARNRSLAQVGNLFSDGVTIKVLASGKLKTYLISCHNM